MRCICFGGFGNKMTILSFGVRDGVHIIHAIQANEKFYELRKEIVRSCTVESRGFMCVLFRINENHDIDKGKQYNRAER